MRVCVFVRVLGGKFARVRRPMMSQEWQSGGDGDGWKSRRAYPGRFFLLRYSYCRRSLYRLTRYGEYDGNAYNRRGRFRSDARKSTETCVALPGRSVLKYDFELDAIYSRDNDEYKAFVRMGETDGRTAKKKRSTIFYAAGVKQEQRRALR